MKKKKQNKVDWHEIIKHSGRFPIPKKPKLNWLALALVLYVISVGILLLIITALLLEPLPPASVGRLPTIISKPYILNCQGDIEVCNEIAEIGIEQGLTQEGIQILLDLGFCESSLRPDAIGRIDDDDRGVWQINRRFHKISDACAFNIKCSTLYTISQIQAGRGYLWDCWDLIN